MTISTAGSGLFLPVFLSLVAFGSFSWALRGHFEIGGRIPDGMRLLSVFSLLSYVIYLGLLFWQGCGGGIVAKLGLVGFAVSILLFWWTVSATRRQRLNLAYTDADPSFIQTRGPYALVRHPFYLSYIIFWLAAALVAGRWQWPPTLILAFWYVRIALGEERRFRSSALSNGYDTYRGQTGMMLPRLGPSRH